MDLAHAAGQGREAAALDFPSTRSLARTAPALFLADERAGRRFWEFFTAHIPNENTRRAYFGAAGRLSAWCLRHGVAELAAVQPVHVAAWLQELGRDHSPADGEAAPGGAADAVRLAGGRPRHGVEPRRRGARPEILVKKGKTPVLAADEARALLDGIDTSNVLGLRDRALIGVMVYTFARVERRSR